VMKDQGHINTLSYSLWLDDLEANTGSILFGGVDTDKYTGDLVALPIQIDAYSGTISSMTVAWTGLTATGGGQVSDLSPSSPQPAILDCGTSFTYLPDEIVDNIFNGLGVLTDPTFGDVVRCSLAKNDLTFSFQFGGSSGPIVNVSLAEFVTPLLTVDGLTPTFRDGEEACAIAIQHTGEDPILFGDSFLRSAYVVFDLENEEIGIAQTNFDSSRRKVQVFESGSGIPGVASTASGATVGQTFTGNPNIPPLTAIGTGGLDGTSRSPTFILTTATEPSSSADEGGSGSSESSNAANADLALPGVSLAGVATVVVLTVSFLFGGGLILY